MAFNPKMLVCVNTFSGGIGRQNFTYDTNDTIATVDTADYFIDAYQYGLVKGSVIDVVQWSTDPAAFDNDDMVSPVATAPTITAAGTLRVLGITTTGGADTANVSPDVVTNTD